MLLDEPEDGVEQYYDGYDYGVDDLSDGERDDRGRYQDDYQEVLELVEEFEDVAALLDLLQFVRAVFCQPLFGFLAAKALLARADPRECLLYGEPVEIHPVLVTG